MLDATDKRIGWDESQVGCTGVSSRRARARLETPLTNEGGKSKWGESEAQWEQGSGLETTMNELSRRCSGQSSKRERRKERKRYAVLH